MTLVETRRNMKKKIFNAVWLILLAVSCLVLLASCGNNTAKFFDYSQDDLGPIGKLVYLMHNNWIGNYGWTVVVFTVFLKILMLPLDFWQRYSSRKSSLKMQRIQPLIESIDKRYGANTQRANEEKQKLYKKQGYSMASMCLPMILSMVIFFVMFGGLRNYSTYSSITSFQELLGVYHETYVEQIKKSPETQDVYNVYKAEYEKLLDEEKSDKNNDALAKVNLQTKIIAEAKQLRPAACSEFEQNALKTVQKYYEEHHESWLWIQNVWQPDTWATIMQPYSGGSFGGGGFGATIDMSGYTGDPEAIYNLIRNAVLETGGYGNNGTWNGLMLLPFLSIGLSFLSMFISQQLEKKNRNGEMVQQNQQQAATNKTMMIVMPLMMAWFGFIYTGAFAIYMVVNYAISIISTLALRWPVEKVVLRKLDKEERKNQSSKASYMR